MSKQDEAFEDYWRIEEAASFAHISSPSRIAFAKGQQGRAFAAGREAERADAEAALAECERENHYQSSYIKQADDTLALILARYDVEHIHDKCGVICKINALEELLAALTGAGEQEKK